MDQKEFTIQVVSLKDKVFRFAKKILNSHEDAQDVLQDVFEKLWEMRDQLYKYDNKEAYIIRSVKNLCLDKLKHEKLKTQKLTDIKINQQRQNITEITTGNDAPQVIKKLITTLPAKQKMIIHLRDIEGYEFEEIADIMDIDINAVRMNLSRARKTIKEKLIKTMNYGLDKH